MKIKSYNWTYLLASLPLIILDASLFMLLCRKHLWAVILIAVVAALIIWRMARTFICMPHSEKAYGKLESYDLNIAMESDADFYLSEEMGRYEFMGRTVEIISPLSFKGQRPKVAINARMVEKYGKRFAQIAATRELLKNEHGVNAKNFVQFITSLLLPVALLLSYFLFRVQLSGVFSYFILNFALPMIISIGFVGLMFYWNVSISKRDYRIDQMLLRYFKKHEVEDFIRRMNEVEGVNDSEKSRKFNNYFSEDRIKKL